MTNVKDIIQEIVLLEKKLENDIEQLKKQIKQEEIKFVSELEKNFLVVKIIQNVSGVVGD
jgi:hypothetical protein